MMRTILRRLKGVLRALGLYDSAIRYGLYNGAIIGFLNLVNRFRWKRIDLVMIVWPPALSLLGDIRKEIEKSHKVIDLEIVEICPNGFQQFVRRLYAVDFAGARKIDPKMERLSRPPHRLGIMTVRITRPHMVVQDALNRVRCATIGELKDGIRKQFRNLIPDYVYDVIIHSTEADYQNRIVFDLLQEYRV